MAGIRVQINDGDLAAIQSKLQQLAVLPNNLDAAFDEIGDYLVSITTQRFRDSKDPDDKSWKSVKRGGKPLVDRGHLRDSITYEAASDSVEVGSNMIYAAIHQLGGQAGRGGSVRIEPRPFLGVSVADEHEIGNILIRRISEQIE